jgi:hypothetical protein
LGVDYSEQLQDAILNARSILNLGDNAGELVLDRLHLETIRKKNIFFDVRGDVILNDVTEVDKNFLGWTGWRPLFPMVIIPLVLSWRIRHWNFSGYFQKLI